MRLFIAIELPQEIREELARIQSHLKYSAADVKWVEKENIHLTLKFLGEVQEEKIEKIRSVLDGIAGGARPFKLSLKDIGAFPKIEYPRVIWVGLDKGTAESEGLAAKLDEELSKIGFEKEARPFSVHLTIGRVRSSKNKDALKKTIASYSLQPAPPAPQEVNSIILFKSTLTQKGPIYSKLHESRLLS